jgi:hypothetical protein
METIEDFTQSAAARDIQVELKQSVSATHPIFKKDL